MQVGDLGYASELGNYAEYSGAPNEEEVLQYARVVIDVRINLYIGHFFDTKILLSTLCYATFLCLCILEVMGERY